MKTNNITTKRFVIRKSLIGTNSVITFTNKKDITFTYDHDEIYSTNTVPAFARNLAEIS